jgi:hypothetical protein
MRWVAEIEVVRRVERMSKFPITPLVRRVQGLILQTFDVSEQVAENYATELVALAEGWGSPENAARLDWTYRIKKDLGVDKKVRWRSDDEHISFEAAEKQKHQAYEAHVPHRHVK